MRYYQALCVITAEEIPTKARHKAVNWMNRMLGMEPAVNQEGQVMAGFYFSEDCFTSDVHTRSHYKALVAINAFFLVLAALNQKKPEKGMHQLAALAGTEWE